MTRHSVLGVFNCHPFQNENFHVLYLGSSKAALSSEASSCGIWLSLLVIFAHQYFPKIAFISINLTHLYSLTRKPYMLEDFLMFISLTSSNFST
jgi:hypothetical protein